MILTDTGPLVALVIRNDPARQLCVNAAKQLSRDPMLTTWPCLTEAMHLVFRASGYPAQAELWKLKTTGRLVIYDLENVEIQRIIALMATYRNVPMDLADASLVAIAESNGYRRVFTLDADFLIYRLADGTNLQTVP